MADINEANWSMTETMTLFPHLGHTLVTSGLVCRIIASGYNRDNRVSRATVRVMGKI